MPAYFTNDDDSIRGFTPDEVDAMDIENLGVRDGSHPTHVRGFNSSAVTVEYKFDWDLRERFMAYMLGAAKTYTDFDTGKLRVSRLLPRAWPGKPKLVAVAVESLTGAGGPGVDDVDGVVEYPKGRARVRYEHVPFDLHDDLVGAPGQYEHGRYVQTLPSRMEVSYLTLPGAMLHYIREDGTGAIGTGTPSPHLRPIPYTIGRPEVQLVRSYKWWRVPYDAWGVDSELFTRVFGDVENGVEPFAGTVNNHTLFGIPPGQMLFLGVEEELVTDPLADELCWHLTFSWLHKPRNHNWLYFNDISSNAPNYSGYYFAGRGTTYYDTGTLPDDVSLFNGRDHNLLYAVGEE